MRSGGRGFARIQGCSHSTYADVPIELKLEVAGIARLSLAVAVFGGFGRIGSGGHRVTMVRRLSAAPSTALSVTKITVLN